MNVNLSVQSVSYKKNSKLSYFSKVNIKVLARGKQIYFTFLEKKIAEKIMYLKSIRFLRLKKRLGIFMITKRKRFTIVKKSSAFKNYLLEVNTSKKK